MKNISTNFRYLLVLYALISGKAATRFNALMDSDWYLMNLYPQEWSPDKPTELDPATTNASTRRQICDDITSSGIFTANGMTSVVMEEVYDELMTQSKYSDIFQRIYTGSSDESEQNSHPTHAYNNPYRFRTFKITKPVQRSSGPAFDMKAEYVFTCVLRKIKYVNQLSDDENSSSAAEQYEDENSADESNQEDEQDSDEDESASKASEQSTSGDPTEGVNLGETEEEVNVEGTEGVNEEGMEEGVNVEGTGGGVNVEGTEEGVNEEGTEEGTEEGEPTEGRLNDLIPFYVSKAYDVTSGIHVHRYLLLDETKFDGDELMLADGSADVYNRPDFHLELHYLELRKHRVPASTYKEDPILKLDVTEFSKEKLIRICTIVATTSYFRDEVGPIIQVYFTTLHRREVSFRTDEGVREANGKMYQELMIQCSAMMTDRKTKEFYISRAYNPFQVFLYFDDPQEGKIYLEILATNVSMAQDRHNFGDVEI